MSCPYEADVHAHFLDGETPASTEVGALAGHLRDCVACQRSLARARRIDALLASVSGVEVDPLLAERMLGRLAVPAPRGAMPRVAAAAALVLLGFLIAWLLLDRDAPAPRPELPPPLAALPPSVPSIEDPRHLMLPDLPATRRPAPLPVVDPFAPPQSADRVALLAERVAAPMLEASMLATRMLLAQAAGAEAILPPAFAAGAAVAAEALRRRACVALLGSAHPEAMPALAAALDRLGPGPTGNALLDVARREPKFVRWLTRDLATTRDPGQALRLAARLGGPELDLAIRRWCGNDRARIDQAGDAVAHAATHPDPAGLLLALWARQDSLTGTRIDPFARAMRWFAPFGASLAGPIERHARATGSAPERMRCLHALAAIAAPASARFLLERLDGPRQDERLLACRALCRLPPEAAADAELRALLPRARAPELVFLVLLAHRDPAALAQLERSGVGAGERALLEAGAITLEQIPALLTLLPPQVVENL
jgi:hypothetical protein